MVVFNASGGSVIVILLLHLLNNIVAGELVMQWFSGADWVRLAWLQALLWGLLASGVLVLLRGNLGVRKTQALPNHQLRRFRDGRADLATQGMFPDIASIRNFCYNG